MKKYILMIMLMIMVAVYPPQVSEASRLRLSITTLELALSNGELFSMSDFQLAITDGSELDYRITTPASPTVSLVGVIIEGIGDGDIELFENGTISVGTSKTIFDLNRITANTATTVIAEGPTVSAAGTSLFKTLLIGGSKNQAIPVVFNNQAALVLKPSEDYLLRITNESGVASDYSIRIVFKE